MPIRHAIISDVHLGQTNIHGSYSLLSPHAIPDTNNSMRAVKILGCFINELKQFKNNEYLSLIVAGDYLDLAMGNNNKAFNDHLKFIEVLPIDELHLVVGNHDHHIWTSRQLQNKELINIQSNKPPSKGSIFDIDTKTFSLVPNNTSKPPSFFHYPSYTIEVNNKVIYITHGHLFGGLYTTISQLLQDYLKDEIVTEELIASVNAPLIEFIYWLLGQVGSPIGTRGLVSAIYNSILEGKTSLINNLVNDGVDTFLYDGIIKGIPDKLERWLVKKVVKSILKKVVQDAARPVSKNRHQKDNATLESVDKWLKEVKKDSDISTIITGHTHKAIDNEVINTNGSIRKYYNTGSWLVEPNHQEPTPLIVFVDEFGNCTSKLIDTSID
jgi:UDP-2,3-diacylglucosamine pyrophosphatase LpxH